MVTDSLFQKMSQNLPIYLPMYPPPRNEKLEIWQKNFYGRFHMTKVQCPPPPEMKSWKSGKKFLWKISHHQSLMYPPPK